MNKSLHIIMMATALTALLVGCNGFTYNAIPDSPVQLDINITADAPELILVLGYKYFVVPQKATQYLGYGGILIYHTIAVEGCPYVAFDLSCPHEAKPDVRLHVNDDGTASCDSCGSVYLILDGTGFATSGPTKNKLRRYTVAQVGDNLYIRR